MRYFKIVVIAVVSICLSSQMILAADGEIDTSFNSPNGYVLWDGGNGYDRGRDIALQSDGKIVVTGYQNNGSDDDLFVIRYNSDGTVDTGFATNGAFSFDGGNGEDGGLAIAIQSDGKIIAAGYRSNGTDIDLLVLRLTTNGILDSSFGTQGTVIYDSGQGLDQAIDLVIQTDDKLVLTGQRGNGSDSEVALWRLDDNGDLDAGFGTNGIASYDVGSGFDGGLRMALQSDGKIVVTGFGRNTLNNDIILLRFSSDGNLDTNFGSNGLSIFDGGDYDRGYGLVIQPDGKILVSGVRSTVVGSDTDYDIPLLRYNTNGSLDTGFGQNGIAIFSNDLREQSFDLAIQDDGKILVVGESGDFNDWALVVLRYNTDGSEDTSFGTNGLYRYNEVGTDWGYGISIDTLGRIVVTGQSSNGVDDDVIILRLENAADDSSGDGDGNGGSGGSCYLDTLM